MTIDREQATIIHEALENFDQPSRKLKDLVERLILSDTQPGANLLCSTPLVVETFLAETIHSISTTKDASWNAIRSAWWSVHHHRYSDPTIDTTPLPQGHEIHLLKEAKKFYKRRDPPFVLQRRKEPARVVVIPIECGHRPRYPTKAELVATPWSDKLMFWTLDANHKRYIVKSFPGGGTGGARYCIWAGPYEDFQEQSVALSDISVKGNSHSLQHEPNEEPPLPGKRRPEPYGPSSSAQPLNTSSPQRPTHATESTSLPASARAHKAQGCFRPSQRPSNKGTVDPVSPFLNENPSSRPFSSDAPMRAALKKGRRPTEDSELPPRLQSPFSASKSTAKPGDATCGSGPSARKRRKTDISAREIDHLYSASSQETQQAESSEPATRAANTHPAYRRSTTDDDADAWCPDFQRPASAQTASSISLDKLSRVLFMIHVAPSIRCKAFQPSGGATSALRFYADVLKVYSIDRSAAEELSVTFPWIPDGNLMKTLILDPTQERGLKHMVKMIDEAPTWGQEADKGEECIVEVEIVLKSGSDI